MEKRILFEKEERPESKNAAKDLDRIQQVVGRFGNPIQLSWPTDYVVVTQGFGANPELYFDRQLPGHEGLDIRAPMGSKVFACADGVVETIQPRADAGQPYGRYLIIAHADGYRTMYGHLSNIVANKGQNVKGGTVIGIAGPTGQTTGGHIHLTLTQQGATAKGLTNFPGDIIDPTPFLSFLTKPRDVFFYPWAFGRCLAGVHFDQQGFALDTSTKAPEAVLLAMDTGKEIIGTLRKNNPTLFLMTQLELPHTSKPVPALEWAAWIKPTVQGHFEAGVGYFAVLHEPNLTNRGCGLHWTSGKEFSRWWMDAVGFLKSSFPAAKFGFPGLAPGLQITGQRLDAANFMEAADDAMLQADWLGVVCNWANPQEMLAEDKGAHYSTLRRYYPAHLLFITKFGNSNPSMDADSRAREAARYFETVANQPGIGAAFARL